MKLLDRFKKKKEQEVGGASKEAPKASVAREESKPKATKEKKEKETKEKKEKVTKVMRAETTKVILAPVVTEKSARMASANTYVFEVDLHATKGQVRTAFKELYGMRPVRVNVIVMRAEPVRFGRRIGKRRAWKKAFVTVPKGKQIQVYEGV